MNKKGMDYTDQLPELKLRWEEDGFFLEQPDGKSQPVKLTVKIVIIKGQEEMARKATLDIVNRWIDEAVIIGGDERADVNW